MRTGANASGVNTYLDSPGFRHARLVFFIWRYAAFSAGRPSRNAVVLRCLLKRLPTAAAFSPE